MKEIFVGKTIEEAKIMAAQTFNVEADKITFNILEEPKKTLFGKYKGEARVEAEYTAPSGEAEKKPKFTGKKSDEALKYILNIFEKMNITAEYSVEENEDGASINLQSGDTSFIIGRRGENLDALQYLTSMVCNRIDDEYYRVILDSNGYRDKRKKTLEDLAKKIAKNVLKSGRSTALEPMNPYERRIIHSMISEIEGVTSRSVGEEPYRKIIISSLNKKPDNRYNNNKKGGYNNKRDNRDGRDNRRNKNYEPKSLDLKTSFEKDYKKPKPEDDIKAGLYGKIEV